MLLEPQLEDAFPELQIAIVAITSCLVGADSKPKTYVLEACHTLDNLHAAPLRQRSSTTRLETFLLALFKADKPSSDVSCGIKFHFSASEQFCDLSLIKTKSISS